MLRAVIDVKSIAQDMGDLGFLPSWDDDAGDIPLQISHLTTIVTTNYIPTPPRESRILMLVWGIQQCN